MSGQGDSGFLVQPPEPNELRLSVGDAVELTPEMQQALQDLVSALGGSEVEGYFFNAPSGSGARPTGATCQKLGNCQPVVSQPCFVDVKCYVKD